MTRNECIVNKKALDDLIEYFKKIGFDTLAESLTKASLTIGELLLHTSDF